MKRSYRQFLLFAGLALAGYVVTSALTSSMSGTEIDSSESANPLVSPGPADPLASPTPGDALTSPGSADPPPSGDPTTPNPDSSRSYAIALHELPGLPPDSPNGTKLELWVTWKPPITKEPRVQRLVTDARLERVVPPLTPEGPPVAVLAVSEKRLPDLIFGDRFGALSATVVR